MPQLRIFCFWVMLVLLVSNEAIPVFLKALLSQMYSAVTPQTPCKARKPNRRNTIQPLPLQPLVLLLSYRQSTQV